MALARAVIAHGRHIGMTGALLDNAVARALMRVERHLNERVKPAELSREVGLSLAYLRSRVRAQLGEPLGHYVRRLRLERAAVALRFSQQPVHQIAVSCGFDSHEGFSRAFRRLYGTSPLAYRQHHAVVRRRGVPGGDLDVRLVERPAWRVAFRRFVGPPAQAGGIWPTVLRLARDQGWARPGAKLLGIHYESPALVTDPLRVRYDAAITVDPNFTGNADVATQDLPGGIDAVIIYRGPLGGLADLWDRFAEGCLATGRLTWRDDRFFDVYLAPPEPWRFPEGAAQAVRGNLEVELHMPIARGSFLVEPALWAE